MKLLVLGLSVAIHVAVGVLFYWMRIRGVTGLARWDAVVFGVPFVVAAVAYFAVLYSSGIVRGVSFSWRIAILALLAVMLGVFVQGVAMTIAANIYGT